MGNARPLVLAAVAAGALALSGCVPSGPPTPEQLAEQFADPIEPAWEVEVPGLFGEPVVRDGLVFAYATDEEVGMRLTVHSAETGELVWEHTASPGGADANPLLVSKDAASRPYPLPAIRPLVVERGEGDEASTVVVFFERDIPDTGTIMPDDMLRVADARTGELLEVDLPDVDADDLFLIALGRHDDGDVYANTISPPWPCGEEWCFLASDEDTLGGSGLIRLDVEALEARYEGGFIPEIEETNIPEWGLGFAEVLGDDDEFVARFEDGAELWRMSEAELFEDARTFPPDYVDFAQVGDVVLIQGYQPILETLEPGEPHTLSLDFAASRTLVAVDAATGEVVWRLPGGDLLCHAVHERPIPADATTVPICLATGGSFVYDLETDELEQEQLEASIVEVAVADGELGWEAEGAGVVSLWHVGRLLDIAFASGADYAVEQVGEDPVLVHLDDGELVEFGEEASFVCKAERDDVELEFEGSPFPGGGNGLTTGYPAGWYHFACDVDGQPIDTWSRGAVRVAGDGDPEGVMVLPLEGSLVGFDLG